MVVRMQYGKSLIRVGVVIFVALLVGLLFWYASKRIGDEGVGTTIPEVYDPLGLGRTLNPRNLSVEEIVRELAVLGRNPNYRNLPEEERQDLVESLGRTNQGQE